MLNRNLRKYMADSMAGKPFNTTFKLTIVQPNLQYKLKRIEILFELQ